jgi:hypothetical protein
LLLHERRVDEIVPKLSAAELEQVIKLVGRSPRVYPPGTLDVLKSKRDMPLPAPTAESLPPNVAAKEQAGADHPHRQYMPVHHGLRRKAQQSTTEPASGADATQNTAERQAAFAHARTSRGISGV